MTSIRTVATSALFVAAASRVTVDVSYGWRFSLGDPNYKCTDALYPLSLNGQRVLGLSHAAGATDPASCLAAACASYADVWEWCTAGSSCGDASCWIGTYPNGSSTQAGWVGGRVNSSAPVPVPPEVAPSFDDTTWSVLDIPHDYEVTGAYSQNADGGEGFLPYNVSYYRKHLTLPAAWAGTRIELYVEGALSASQWWLNGVPLGSGATFHSGYTSLILRLDDSPAIVLGGPNIIAAYVDGTRKTGWWCVRRVVAVPCVCLFVRDVREHA